MPGIGALHRRAAVKMMKREVPHGLRSVVGICCTAYVAVWPIATSFTLGPDVSFRGKADVPLRWGRSFVGAVMVRRGRA